MHNYQKRGRKNRCDMLSRHNAKRAGAKTVSTSQKLGRVFLNLPSGVSKKPWLSDEDMFEMTVTKLKYSLTEMQTDT